MEPTGYLCDSVDRSVEARRRYDWLRMMFSGVRLFRAPIWCPSGGWRHARGREHCRGEPDSSLGWVRTRFGEGGGQFDRRRARGGLNPCARESKARTGRFLKEKPMSDHGHFSPYEDHKEWQTGNIWGLFQGCAGLWTAGCWLARRLHQPKASTTMDLGISIFHILVQCVALRNLDLLIKTGWSVTCPLCC